MAAMIGTLNARILIQYGDNPPVEVATVEQPLEVTGPGATLSVGIDQRVFLRRLRKAFRRAARSIR